VLTESPMVLASEFPPGPESFDYRSLIPGLEGNFWEPAFTKIALLTWLTVAILIIFFLVAYRKPQIVPTKLQWIAESIYGIARDNIARDVIGKEGVRFAPYLATLFVFILMNNLWGIIPLAQISPNSHIAFPIVLAGFTYVVYIAVGVRKQGVLAYAKNSIWVSGAPLWVQPILVPIEFFQVAILRPATLAIRLFANMFAGHMILLVFTLGGVVLFESHRRAEAGRVPQLGHGDRDDALRAVHPRPAGLCLHPAHRDLPAELGV